MCANILFTKFLFVYYFEAGSESSTRIVFFIFHSIHHFLDFCRFVVVVVVCVVYVLKD